MNDRQLDMVLGYPEEKKKIREIAPSGNFLPLGYFYLLNLFNMKSIRY